MCAFNGYEKIPESFKQLKLSDSDNKLLDKTDWVVTEKVHGANFSFISQYDEIRYAKRKEYLDWSDDFFGFQIVADRLDSEIRELFSLIKENHKFGKCTVYGELFGGEYPHNDIPKDPKAKRVQKGVFYCPHNDFYAYDLKINGQFVNYDIFSELMVNCGFLYAEALYRGDYDSCLAYPNDFQTTIPDKFDFPEIEDNICEGVVLKPVVSLFFPNGERVILKNKNDKFAEKQKERKPRKEKEPVPPWGGW